MCSPWRVVAGYWKMSLAIQSIRICEIVHGFRIPWGKNWLSCSMNRKCFMISWLVISCQQLASQMPRDTTNNLHRVLNRIREENNQMKIRLNWYQTQVKIRELVECKLYEQAWYMQSLLAANIYQSDVEMSNEE